MSVKDSRSLLSTPATHLWDKIDKQEKEKDYKISKNVLEQITKEAFDIFDPEANGYVWRTDVGTIIRSLGLNPSQKEVEEILSDIEDNGRVSFQRYQDKMVDMLLENKIARDDENKIKRAFQVIDTEKRGYIEPDKLSGLLTTLGEPFTQEELEEMYSVALDPDKGVIFYEEYSNLLAND